MADVTATPGMDPAPEALVDDRTARGWPLPHRRNKIATDNERLRAALSSIDTELTAADTFAAATDRELARYEAATDETLAQHRTELDALDRDKANEESVSRRFATLEHDGLQALQTGAWRHLTPLQLSAFPELEAGDKLTTEGGMIANVDLGAQTGSPAARLPEVGGLWAYVAGMGLYRLDRSSAALLDGETAILPASRAGRWLLHAPSAGLMFDMTDETFWTSCAIREANGGAIPPGGTATILSDAAVTDILRVEPPAGFPLPWQQEADKTYLCVTVRNDTDAQVTLPPTAWTVWVRVRADGVGLDARRALKWLGRASPDADAIEDAMADSGNLGAFEALMRSPLRAAVLRGGGLGSPPTGSPESLAEIARSDWRWAWLIGDGWPGNGDVEAATRGAMTDPAFWARVLASEADARALWETIIFPTYAPGVGLRGLFEAWGWEIAATDNGSKSSCYNYEFYSSNDKYLCRLCPYVAARRPGIWIAGVTQKVAGQGNYNYRYLKIYNPGRPAKKLEERYSGVFPYEPPARAEWADFVFPSSIGSVEMYSIFNANYVSNFYWDAELWTPPAGWVEEALR